MSLLIVGCGYVGTRVARAWRDRGETVAALTRSAERALELKHIDIDPVVADWLDASHSWTLSQVRFGLVSVPHRPDERFGTETHSVGLSNFVARLPSLERLVVLSTTGVYQQSDGEWVDETSATRPTRIGPQIALAAEKWLRENLAPQRATVLRLAGIYGPGRVPLIGKLTGREPIPVAEGELNLIHVDDIAQAIVKLLDRSTVRPLYVLSDGQPVARRKFYEEAARIFATPPPVFVEPDPGSSRSVRGESNKRVRPQRIIDDLDLEFEFPNHVAGLTAIAAEQGAGNNG